ncbi:MAG: glycosyltransferase, partial [Chloroflexi bacterium]|nr:glycosyltransferase [Chloroflexota bacterium]
MFAGKEPSHSWHERRVAGKHQRRVFSILILLALIAILALSIYVLFRGMAFFGPGYGWLDRLFAVLLICCELYIFIHAMAYFVSTIKATTRYDVTGDTVFISSVTPFVAVVIASFNEDPAVLEDTIVSAVTMDYWHKKVYVVDDSTDERLRAGIHDLALRYECAYVRRDNRRGYKAGAINDLF